MKIISLDTAKVTALFSFEEVAPLSPSEFPGAFEKVGKRYSFNKLPDRGLSNAEVDKSGIRFENGFLISNNARCNIIDCTIFGDGMVITAKTTEEGEVFWNDISTWVQAELGFRSFITEPSLRFISQIVVEFDRPLSHLFGGYQEFVDIVSGAISPLYEAETPMELARFDLAFDKVGRKSSTIVPLFSIERRVSVDFQRERYMCNAPMRTTDHINVLRKIEAML